MTKLFQGVQLKNKPVVFSQECRLIYTHSALLMLQIRLSEVCQLVLLLETFIFLLSNLYDEVKFSTGWCRWTGWGLGGWWISEIGGSAAATWRCQCRRLRSSLWEKKVLRWWENSQDIGSINKHWLYPQTCPPCEKRPGRKRICRCLSCHRSPPDNKQVCVTYILNNKFTSCSAFNTLLPSAQDWCVHWRFWAQASMWRRIGHSDSGSWSLHVGANHLGPETHLRTQMSVNMRNEFLSVLLYRGKHDPWLLWWCSYHRLCRKLDIMTAPWKWGRGISGRRLHLRNKPHLPPLSNTYHANAKVFLSWSSWF